jgi:hypothetical protein
MNVVGSKRRSSVGGKEESHDEGNIDMYLEPPQVEISLDDFEVYALKRLKVRECHVWRVRALRALTHACLLVL